MALFERTYSSYAGRLTPTATRFLILPRYAYREVFRSRLFTGLFAISFLFPIGLALFIYVKHNLDLLGRFRVAGELPIPIDAKMFALLMSVQGFLGFFQAVILAPALVAPDLVNGAFPLYAARPFSRWEYVLGKFCVLSLLLSAVSWVPATLLFFLNGDLETTPWIGPNLKLLGAILASGALYSTVLPLFTLAVSAWVRSKSFARGALIGTLFISRALGQIVNRLLDTEWGSLISAPDVIGRIFSALFGLRTDEDVPLVGAIVSVLVVCGLSLYLLHKKLRALEVVA